MQNDDDMIRKSFRTNPVGDLLVETALRRILSISVRTPGRIVQGLPEPSDRSTSDGTSSTQPMEASAWGIIEAEIHSVAVQLPKDEQENLRRKTIDRLMHATSSRLERHDVFRRFCIRQVHAICLTAICSRAIDPHELD